jgi:DNA-binding NarL/FixJ family response regulator
MIRTLVVEGSGVARLGIRSLLGAQAQELEIDQAASVAVLLEKLAERYYELIIVEPALCAGTGTKLVRQLREACPWAAILVFTELDELSFGVDAIRSGARGYLMKTCQRDEFRRAVKRVGAGQVYLSQALAAEFANRVRRYDRRNKPHDSFSQREFQIFSMMVCGMTAVESAHLLQMSTEAVRGFRDSVMSRLQASTAQDLVEYAHSQGLMDDCSWICSALWSGRYDQGCVASPYAAIQSASSAAMTGFEMR